MNDRNDNGFISISMLQTMAAPGSLRRAGLFRAFNQTFNIEGKTP
jgi:hypothetical protein